jgi:hypothetical protein
MVDKTPMQELLVTFYFMITTLTTVGYGDLYPKNIYEMSLMIFIMLIGIALFSYVIGGFHAIIENFNEMNNIEDKRTELM